MALAEEALGDMVRQNSRVVGLADIEKAVCKVFGLESRTLQSADKSRRVSQPRMLAMWLARKHTRAALSEIGQFFGKPQPQHGDFRQQARRSVGGPRRADYHARTDVED